MPVIIGGILLAGIAYAVLRGAGKPHNGPYKHGEALYAAVKPPAGVAPPVSTEEALAYNVVMPFPSYDTGLVPSSGQRSTMR